jgi:hypothetical protein
MTARDELDRVLGEWLAEGPTRAPDWPIDRAIEHARTHPRRPDPLTFLRAPAFPAQVGAFNPRPALLFAAALLLALAATALVVGSRPSQAPVVVPPSLGPTASPSAPSSASPTPLASASPRHVDLKIAAGQPASVDIQDETGLLVEAVSGQPGDGVSVDLDRINVVKETSSRLRLTWSGGPCETDYGLSVQGTADTLSFVLERPACEGDAIALDRVLIVTFSEVITDRQIETRVQGAGATSQP